jgi:excinuclease ABC subunit A
MHTASQALAIERQASAQPSLAERVSRPTKLAGHTWPHAVEFPIRDIAAKVVREIGLRLKFLNDVGLNYLSLDRSAETLSGGESQRIRLASQIGSGLTGVMYVLDEPSIGLHQRDNDRLIDTLKHLRDIGNSVLVVEHDEDMMRAADHIIDMGVGAGVHGGRIIAQGNFEQVKANTASLTGQYLAQTLKIAVPKMRTPWLPTVAPKPGDEDKFKSRNAPSPAAVRRAEREAHHRATQAGARRPLPTAIAITRTRAYPRGLH